jgi:hypothetical protein
MIIVLALIQKIKHSPTSISKKQTAKNTNILAVATVASVLDARELLGVSAK